MNADLPQMSQTNYAAALHSASQGVGAGPNYCQTAAVGMPLYQPQNSIPTIPTITAEPKTMPTCRLVKVFIADADENVPLEKRLLYRGDELMTDLTDQELFFEVPITDLLSKHNEYRKTLEDKKAKKEKPVMLEPIRVRDLKMLVVALASF